MNEGDIKYLEHKYLKEVSGFRAALQLKIRGDRPVFVGLRDDAISVFTDEGKQYFYDLEGRPWRLSTLNYNLQRGLSHRGVRLTKRPKEKGGGFEREILSDEELAAFCRELWDTGIGIKEAIENTPPGRIKGAKPDYETAVMKINPVINKISRYSPEMIIKEKERFASVYHPIPVLPPDHYRAFVLQATEGCPFNTCTFCSLYRGTPFRVRDKDEFRMHIQAAIDFMGDAVIQRSTIFLGQANAVSIPQNRLTELLKIIREHVTLPLPDERPVKPAWRRGKTLRFTGIGAFIDGFTGLKKTTEDYRELYGLGLDRVYLGVESGSEEILQWIKKPADRGEMLETLGRLKKAGIAADIIVLVGIGGKEYETRHINETLKFIEKSPLTKGDRVYLSEMVEHPGAPYSTRMDHDGIPRLTRDEIRKQTEIFKSAVKRIGLQPVPYRIDPFVF